MIRMKQQVAPMQSCGDVAAVSAVGFVAHCTKDVETCFCRRAERVFTKRCGSKRVKIRRYRQVKGREEGAIFHNLLHRIKNMQKSHWRIAKGMAWVTLFVFIAKLVGAAKEMAIAYRYGVNEIVDSYVFAFSIVTWLPAVWHGVLEVVLVPLFVQLAQREKRVFFAELTGFTLFVGVVLTLLFVVRLPFVTPYIFTYDSGEVNDYATYFAIGLAPVAFAGMLVGTFFTRLLAEERHANTMMEMLPSLLVLMAVLAW